MTQVDGHIETVNDLDGDLKDALSEKRDFYSFLLTIVTIVFSPLTIYTGDALNKTRVFDSFC